MPKPPKAHFVIPNTARTACKRCGRLIFRTSARGWIHVSYPGRGRPATRAKWPNRAREAAARFRADDALIAEARRRQYEDLRILAECGMVANRIAGLIGRSDPWVRYMVAGMGIRIVPGPKHPETPTKEPKPPRVISTETLLERRRREGGALFG